MLKSLRVENFRALDELQIDRLARVNLIVGKNNVGKTTLLEAIHLYESKDVYDATTRILQRRDEYSIERNGDQFNLENLFSLGSDPWSSKIKIGEIGGETLGISSAWTWREERRSEDGQISVHYKLDENRPKNVVGAQVRFVFHSHRKDRISIGALDDAQYLSEILEQEVQPETSLLLPSSGFTTVATNIDELWDRVVLENDKIDIVLEVLGLVTKVKIERLAFVQGKRDERLAVVKLNDRRAMPLRSLGDGANKLFELALGLVTSGQGGTFLVDEIDSGIHFSVLPDIWKMVIQTAKKLDVQVFATTHSWDCIKAFQEASESIPGESLLVSLENSEDGLRSEVFTESELSVITRQSIEVR
ncbi:MAG: ATP/GTP-binding protein [Geitlerinemataceae cyanobacterium]